MKELFRAIIDADSVYSGNGMMFALYLVMLLMIVFIFKNARLKKTFTYPSVILLLVLFIGVPLSGRVLDEEMTRLFWLLLTPLVTAIGFTYIIIRIENRKKRLLFICLLVPLFLICGTFQISNYRFKPHENAYKLPQPAVDITNKMLSETASPKLIVPYTFAYPFRQISSDVTLLFGEDATYGRIMYVSSETLRMLASQMEMTTPDLNYITSKMDYYGVNYIVFDTVYHELCENGNINVHGYPVDADYVGDRTSTIALNGLTGVSVIGNEDEPYWDLSAYDLEYDGTYGQYILYKYK